MMPFILLAVGFLLIFLEFYLPGGIMGTLGGIVVVGSIVSFAMEYESPILTVLYTVVVVTLCIFLFRYALWRIKHAKPGYSIYSNADQEGYIASTYDKEAIGKTAIVSSVLRPGGQILIDGKKHSAISQSGYINKGEEVIVIGGQGETLIVKSKKQS